MLDKDKMISILSQKIIRLSSLVLNNFIYLSEEEKLMVLSWRNSPGIRKWMYNDREITKEEHFSFISSLKTRRDAYYWLVKKDKDPIGVLCFNRLLFNNSAAYYGIYSNPFSKISGLGRILDKAAIELSFEVLGLHSLHLEVIETNLVVINMHKKMGFREEGRLKEFIFRDGKWLDVIIMGQVNKGYGTK